MIKKYQVNDSDMEPSDLTNEQLDDIEQEEIARIRESRAGPTLNGRMVLRMIREIRRARNNG